MRRAITDYNMISDGDNIVVGVSGGKDSVALLSALRAYQRFSPESFTLSAVTVDMGFKDASQAQFQALTDYIGQLEVPFHVVKTDIAEIIFDARKESNPCSLCSKMRRGALNTKAVELGANKLALGHHADDVVETMLLSLLYEGRFSTFQPVSYMDRSKITLIRPFIYTDERDIKGLVSRKALPIFKNPCPADKHTCRESMKNLIKTLQEDIPFAKERMLGAIYNPERNNLWKKP